MLRVSASLSDVRWSLSRSPIPKIEANGGKEKEYVMESMDDFVYDTLHTYISTTLDTTIISVHYGIQYREEKSIHTCEVVFVKQQEKRI